LSLSKALFVETILPSPLCSCKI